MIERNLLTSEPDDRSPGWQDRLVELRVLSEHGDLVAAHTAQRWLARDQDARRRWERVRADCDQVRAEIPAVRAPGVSP